MATKDKDGKLTYQMTSPGEAWMKFVDSPEGHNAAAFTPSYLKEDNSKQSADKLIQQRFKDIENRLTQDPNLQLDKNTRNKIDKEIQGRDR